MARDFRSALRLCALIGFAWACSSESGTTHEGSEPELEGELCVDPNDACCCDEELQLAEPAVGGPACAIDYQGDASGWTF
ncbi:MAG TPA: hypothetical protein VF103_11505, partial [Polyangiaceae bacterium]